MTLTITNGIRISVNIVSTILKELIGNFFQIVPLGAQKPDGGKHPQSGSIFYWIILDHELFKVISERSVCVKCVQMKENLVKVASSKAQIHHT